MVTPAGRPHAPALYAARTVHLRRERVDRRFRYGTYLWFVDLDDLPRLPRPFSALARFRARDHVGDPADGIRANIDALLAEHELDVRGGRVLMLASAAVLGHVFNPLSLFWCFEPGGALRCVVAEVHNTYGGRHAYVLRPDDHDTAEADKRLYVSPFFAVDGRYTLRVPVPEERLGISVRLYRGGERPVFTATLTGRRRPGRLGELLRLLARYPFPTLRVSALIRWQGVRIWLRGLPVVPRTPATPTRTDRQEVTR